MHKLTCPQRTNLYASCVCAAIEQREHTKALQEYNERERTTKLSDGGCMTYDCPKCGNKHLTKGGRCLACDASLRRTMQAPESNAGRLTELIMTRVRGKLPELPTHEYNRVYECVLSELTLHVLGETHEVPERKLPKA